MFAHLLLATDGSAHADRAAEAALNLAKKSNARVTLLHVSPTVPSRHELLQAEFNVLSLLKEEAHRAIIRTELMFRNENIPFTLEVALGDPAEEIIKLANSGPYDLVIIGSRGLNRFKEIMLGSVSRKVAHDAKCPVMIIK